MPKPYENKRELIDDLLMLYGQVTGAVNAGGDPDIARIVESLGTIIKRAHTAPAGHAANLARAQEVSGRSKEPSAPERTGSKVVPMPHQRGRNGLRKLAGL